MTLSPSRCPPFINTAFAPSLRSLSPACFISSMLLISIDVRYVASLVFGVIIEARGKSSLMIRAEHSGLISGSPLVAIMTGSSTMCCG